MSLVLGIDEAWTTHDPSGVALVAAESLRPELIRASPSYEDFIVGAEPQADMIDGIVCAGNWVPERSDVDAEVAG